MLNQNTNILFSLEIIRYALTNTKNIKHSYALQRIPGGLNVSDKMFNVQFISSECVCSNHELFCFLFDESLIFKRFPHHFNKTKMEICFMNLYVVNKWKSCLPVKPLNIAIDRANECGMLHEL